MREKLVYGVSCICAVAISLCYGAGTFVENNWKFHFPQGSSMGLFLAIAIPLELKEHSAYLAYNFEANYALPSNTSRMEYPPLIQRQVDRKLVYNVLESKLQTKGYSGRGCLLRIICEAAAVPIHEINGVLGDLLHIVLTPSTSKNANITSDYEKAERVGNRAKNCINYHKNCSVSFMDLFSWFGVSK